MNLDEKQSAHEGSKKASSPMAYTKASWPWPIKIKTSISGRILDTQITTSVHSWCLKKRNRCATATSPVLRQAWRRSSIPTTHRGLSVFCGPHVFESRPSHPEELSFPLIRRVNSKHVCCTLAAVGADCDRPLVYLLLYYYYYCDRPLVYLTAIGHWFIYYYIIIIAIGHWFI